MSKITAIIPTYNRSSLLRRAIKTVQHQSWKDLKIVVRDNCSSDDTESVVAAIAIDDKRVFYEKLVNNIGAHDNIRFGIKSVDTEYFTFLCDDDYLEIEFYDEAIKIFHQYPDASFVAFRVDIVDLNGKIINSNSNVINDKLKIKYYNSEDGIKAYLNGSLPGILTGYVFKKEVAKSIDFGIFNEVGYGADIFFIWHAAARFNFVVTNIKGGNFTSHANNTSSTLVKCFDERFLYWWRNRLLIIKNDPFVSIATKNIISRFYLNYSTKSFTYFKYYSHAAILLIADKVKKRQYYELKFDFIAMKSFLPWPILLCIKYTVVFLVYFKMYDNLRLLIRFIRNLK